MLYRLQISDNTLEKVDFCCWLQAVIQFCPDYQFCLKLEGMSDLGFRFQRLLWNFLFVLTYRLGQWFESYSSNFKALALYLSLEYAA